LGGSGFDFAESIAVDSEGSAYITGGTFSPDFPITPGAFQTVCANHCFGTDPSGTRDAFISKIDPSGSALLYSTYLGGSGNDDGNGIALDSERNVYITGSTTSTDFPVLNPLQTTYGGGTADAFVAKVNPLGSALIYSTYLGGNESDDGIGIAVNTEGSAYVTGQTGSSDFPTTPGAFQTVCANSCSGADTFVTKIDPSGSALVYSTYLGGSGFEGVGGLALDGQGDAYVTGSTTS